jgi:hypothetical protein
MADLGVLGMKVIKPDVVDPDSVRKAVDVVHGRITGYFSE